MECFRLYLHDSSLPVRGQPAGLFGNKRHRITLVQQSQFSSRMRTCLRVKEHPTLQHIPMEISHQRPDITGRVWTLRCLIFFLAILDKFFHTHREIHVITLVNGIYLSTFWCLHVRVRQTELPDRSIQRETIHPVTGSIH